MIFRRTNGVDNGIPVLDEPRTAGPSLIRLGTTDDKESFAFPLSLLGNMHIRGMSGSGKTSLSLIPIVAQLIRFGYPVFVIDLGGDISMYHNVNEVASGLRASRLVALDPLIESQHFPPIQTLKGVPLIVSEISQRLLRGFNLDFGAALHGPTYYTAQALAATLSVGKQVFAENPGAGLQEVDHYLNLPGNKKAFKDADAIRMNVRFMLEYPVFSWHEDPEQNIIVERAIENREVCYFFCPSLDDPIVSPLAGGLALSTIIHIASARVKRGRPRIPVYVIVDEFAEIVGRSLASLLAQGRKYGLRFILANQSSSQLETRDTKLTHALFEGTTVKQYFTCVGDEDTKVLQSVSQDKIRSLGGSTVQGLSTSVSYRDSIVPTLERDDILRVSETFGQSFVLLNDGNGHHEPYIVTQSHGDFPDLSEKPMPLRESAVSPDPKEVRPRASQKSNEGSRNTAENASLLDQRIAALIEKKQGEERWQIVAVNS